MAPDETDWGTGKVVFWDLTFLDAATPLEEQANDLKEDLVQVSYPGGVVLDIGWYPDCAPDGEFMVLVVKDADWQSPALCERARTVDQLQRCVTRAVAVAQRLGGE